MGRLGKPSCPARPSSPGLQPPAPSPSLRPTSFPPLSIGYSVLSNSMWVVRGPSLRTLAALLVAALAAGCQADPPAPGRHAVSPASDAAGGARLVHRRRRERGPRLRALQRHVGRALLSGDHGARRRRCSTTTTTAISTSTSFKGRCSAPASRSRDATFPPQGPLAGSAVSQRPDRGRGRHAHAAVHRRRPSRAGSTSRSYGMGVAAGDFDNDGWIDIYRTGLRPAA